MRLNFKVLVAVGVIAGIAEAWWSYDPAEESATETAPAPTSTASPVLKARARAAQPRTTVAATAAPGVATWKTKITEVLASANPPGDQAQSLLALFPSLPPAEQFQTAHHISNLLPNDSYASWSTHLTNTAVAPEVRNVIYADLLQRPDAIKLPMLLVLARAPASGRAPEALALLRQALRADYGTDWTRWEQGIEARLKPQPD
jgi:hypothetical protein